MFKTNLKKSVFLISLISLLNYNNIKHLKAETPPIPPSILWGYVTGMFQEGDTLKAGIDLNNNGILDSENANTLTGSEIFTTSTIKDGIYSLIFPADDTLTSIVEGGIKGDEILIKSGENYAYPTVLFDYGTKRQDIRFTITNIKEQYSNPKNFTLQNYPNPFNNETKIEFNLPQKSQVNLSIYNIKGQKIEELVNQTLNSGTYKTSWIPKSPSGVYFYKLITEQYQITKKMVFSK